MHAITWIPGTRPTLDLQFHQLRENQYQDKSHRLWSNYAIDSFSFAVAFTMVFNDFNEIEICSSIAARNCWPENVYRILNRTWKNSNRQPIMKKMSAAMGCTTLSQIQWLKDNTDCELYFISRQSYNWTTWVQNQYKNEYNLNFYIGPKQYLTCPNECDDSCWQYILYAGNDKLLDMWKSK